MLCTSTNNCASANYDESTGKCQLMSSDDLAFSLMWPDEKADSTSMYVDSAVGKFYTSSFHWLIIIRES